ncbi:hypothetical protein FHS61_001007 [Altererythrobacter atlanticus]|uniref:Uncharacterized protein n=1 Tax=Croceibacterium atlanticum TaxID=1267766 RepID=A0A0F7KVT6_9SPHN|nr:hypothetical protein WYH_02259 [Croceibacterium atlanticum]MBB5732003.1 hypothetical protein [Croceibacterium atlanticum]
MARQEITFQRNRSWTPGQVPGDVSVLNETF